MDIQEQAISKKQQMMDFCVGKALEILKESIETRAEHLSDDKMDEVEQKEYDRAMEELTQTYVRFPAVQHIKDYLHLPDYIWQSDFLENLTMEQKRKWYHQPIMGNYSDFCNDNTSFDDDCPLFSAIYKVVVNEKYAQYLLERMGQRNELRQFREKRRRKKETEKILAEVDAIISDMEEKLSVRQAEVQRREDAALRSVEEVEHPSEKPIEIPTEETNPFNHKFTESQIAFLAEVVNKVHLFWGKDVTEEEMRAIFDCKVKVPLKSKNNRLLAQFFSQLSYREYITESWQSVVAKHKLFISSRKDDYINQSDLSSACNHLNNSQQSGNYLKISNYIQQLKKQ